jgi:Sec-independent protein secretion pathway component TatC
MFLLMVPMIVLYSVGVWLASSFGRPAPWANLMGNDDPTPAP